MLTREVFETFNLIFKAYANLRNWQKAFSLFPSMELIAYNIWERNDHRIGYLQRCKAICLSHLGRSKEAMRINNNILEKRKNYFGDKDVLTINTELSISYELFRAGNLTKTLKLVNECLRKLSDQKHNISALYYNAITLKVNILIG